MLMAWIGIGRLNGATLTVTSAADDGPGSLRQALADAASGDTIRIPLTNTIQLASGLVVSNKSLTLIGSGQTNLVVSGGPGVRPFTLVMSTTNITTVQDLTIAGGDLDSGGAGGLDGGGMLCTGGSLTLKRVELTGNRADRGGGLAFVGPTPAVDAKTVLQMLSCSIHDNQTRYAGDGGGVLTKDVYVFDELSRIERNLAAGNGGGLRHEVAPTLVWTTCYLTGSIIRENAAGGSGGGIHLLGRSSLWKVWSEANVASNTGGGAALQDGWYDISVSTFAGNVAARSGGGLSAEAGILVLRTSTVSGNRAGDGSRAGRGGGCFLEGSARMGLRACTVASNLVTSVAATAGIGGGIDNALSTRAASIDSTIVAGNEVLAGGPGNPGTWSHDVAGTIDSAGHNLIGNATGSTGIAVDKSRKDLAGTAAKPVDPLLGPLEIVGNSLPTHALREGSPAIDRGSTPYSEYDQRAISRPMGTASDIGPVEFAPTVAAPINLGIDPGVDGPGAVAELVAAIKGACANSRENTIRLYPGGIYVLQTVDNWEYGPNALPVITGNVIIEGNGARLRRDAAAPAFRFFNVSGGFAFDPVNSAGTAPGRLVLRSLTMENGWAKGGDSGTGGGGAGMGGAIFSQGLLTLEGVTLTGNVAKGGASGIPGLGAGGGGVGQNAIVGDAGGGFGGPAEGFGGKGLMDTNPLNGTGGGGGGFLPGSDATDYLGGGSTGLGGGDPFGNGDGGNGGDGTIPATHAGGAGGDYGTGGMPGAPDSGGGGGGVGGGGGAGGFSGNWTKGGSGGFGGGGGAGQVNGGAGGFGGGGGGGDLASNNGGFGGGKGGVKITDPSTPGGGGGGGFGGALFIHDGMLNLVNCTLTGNTAMGGAGAPGSGSQGGNGGSAFGGAIFILNGDVSLINCTVAANTTTAGAGGVSTTPGSPGLADGGAIYLHQLGPSLASPEPLLRARVLLENSILATSHDSAHDLTVTGNAYAGLDYPNLVQSSSGRDGGTISGLPVSTSDPQLGPLGNHGGPTPTMVPAWTSPVVDAGYQGSTTPATDQRGLARVTDADGDGQARVDLGAVERPSAVWMDNMNDAGPGSLRQTLADAPDDGVVVLPAFGEILLTSGELAITKSLRLRGPGRGQLAIKAGGASRIFSVSAATTNWISGVTIRDGRTADGNPGGFAADPPTPSAAGGGIHNAGTLVLTDCEVSHCGTGTGGWGELETGASAGPGGGIYSRGSLFMTNCVLQANSTGAGGDSFGATGGSGGDGGSVYNDGTLVMDQCLVSSGAAGPGGSTSGPGGGNGGHGGNGGGVYSSDLLMLHDCRIVNNTAGSGGNAFANTAGTGGDGGDGGGILARSTSEVVRCSILHNAAGNGGIGGDGSVTVGGKGGQGGGGGGLYISGGSRVISSTINQNFAGVGGDGGPSDQHLGQPGAGGSGGGLDVPGAVELQQVTIAFNGTQTGGKGWDHGLPIVGTAGFGGGLNVRTNAFAQLDSVLIARNQSPDLAPDAAGPLTSLGYNLMGIADGSSGLKTFLGDLSGTVAAPLDPKLGPLKIYDVGSISGQVYPLLAGSPAIDAGNPNVASRPDTDQRGVPRLGGASPPYRADIGAYEVHVPTISAIADQVMDEDGTLGPVAFEVVDVDSDPTTLTVSALESAPGLLTDIYVGGAGTNRTILATPFHDRFGINRITVTVTDDDGASATRQFQFTIQPVADPPRLDPIGAASTLRNVPSLPILMSASDADPGETDQLVWSASSGNPSLVANAGLLLSGTGAQATLVVTPLPDRFGIAPITVTVKDPTGAIASRTFDFTIFSGPVIVAEPVSLAVNPGAPASLAVAVEGTEPLAFQWFRNGLLLPDATNRSLLFPHPAKSDSSDYSVLITNDWGVVTSRVATLKVSRPPVAPAITSEPPDQSVSPQATLRLELVTESDEPVEYRWRRNGVNLTDGDGTGPDPLLLRRGTVMGASSNVLTIVGFQPADAGTFRVAVQNIHGVTESRDIHITPATNAVVLAESQDEVSAPPLPGDSGTVISSTVGFAGATGWFDWVAPADGIARFTSAGSGFDTQLILPARFGGGVGLTVVGEEDGGGYLTSYLAFNTRANQLYRLALSGSFGQRGAVVLSWQFVPGRPLPVVLRQPLSQVVTEGDRVALEVGLVDSTLPVEYQWILNGVDLAEDAPGYGGIRESRLEIPRVSRAQAGVYSVRVTDRLDQSHTIVSGQAVVEVAAGLASEIPSEYKPELLIQRILTASPGVRGVTRGAAGLASGSSVSSGTIISDNYRILGYGGQEQTLEVGGSTRWYYLRITNSGLLNVTAAIRLNNVPVEGLLELYQVTPPAKGTTVTNLAPIAGARGFAGQQFQAEVHAFANASQLYLAAVDGHDAQSGTVELHWDVDQSLQPRGATRWIGLAADPDADGFLVVTNLAAQRIERVHLVSEFVTDWNVVRTIPFESEAADNGQPDRIWFPTRARQSYMLLATLQTGYNPPPTWQPTTERRRVANSNLQLLGNQLQVSWDAPGMRLQSATLLPAITAPGLLWNDVDPRAITTGRNGWMYQNPLPEPGGVTTFFRLVPRGN